MGRRRSITRTAIPTSAAAGSTNNRLAVTESASAAPASIIRLGESEGRESSPSKSAVAAIISASAIPYPRAATMKSSTNGFKVSNKRVRSVVNPSPKAVLAN